MVVTAGALNSQAQEELCRIFDLARLQDGDSPRDPADFARRVAAALAG